MSGKSGLRGVGGVTALDWRKAGERGVWVAMSGGLLATVSRRHDGQGWHADISEPVPPGDFRTISSRYPLGTRRRAMAWCRQALADCAARR